MPTTTILIVDDSPTTQRIIRLAVEAGGYQVLTASDGDEAIDVARREHPDLVVLDIILPKRNGFQVCRHLKAFPETCGIKVVLLSSKSHEMDILWGKRQGADGYLTKPFESEQLLACIDTALRSESGSPVVPIATNTVDNVPISTLQTSKVRS